MEYRKVKYKVGMSENYDYVTRDGRKVHIAGYKLDAFRTNVVIGWVDGMNLNWDVNGNFASEEHDFDLFALAECETKYINIHEDHIGKWADERLYDFRKVAEENGKLSITYNQTIEIEL